MYNIEAAFALLACLQLVSYTIAEQGKQTEHWK